MDVRFLLKRVLWLVSIVMLLSFVYFMVSTGHSLTEDSLENPARIRGHQLPAPAAATQKTGWLVLEDPEDPLSLELRDAVNFTFSCLGYTPSYTSTISQEQLDFVTEGVMVTVVEWGKMDMIEALLSYAQKGGTLVFAIRPEVDDAFRSTYQRLGIYEHGYFYNSEGIVLEPGLLTKEAYVMEENWLENSAIALHVDEYCEVYATNTVEMPLIWSLPYGKGKILFMNNSLMTRKASGGLMVSLLSKLKGPLIYPVINSRVLALEYFPLPADINREFLRELYLRPGPSFLRDVWWSDMVRLSLTHSIPYSAALVSGYDNEESSIRTITGLREALDLTFYVKELARYSGEICFSGFNQKPLFFGNLSASMTFTPWSDAGLAAQRSDETLTLFSEGLPRYKIYAYLPPERLLDAQGYEIIREQMPDLQVICGDFQDRELWYQDFGVDENGIAAFPAITSGFRTGATEEWDLLCVANGLGVVFHSCNVSSLLGETNPDNSWNIIGKEFFEFADKALTETNYLDGLTITNASERLRDMLALNPDIQTEQNRVTITVAEEKELVYFMLHCPGKTPQQGSGYTLKNIGGDRYFVTADSPHFVIELVNK